MSRRMRPPRFEAALNLLREQRRGVEETRRLVMADDDLRTEDPRHRQALLDQMLAEIAQLSEATAVLERLQAGEAAYPDAPDGPCVASADLPAMQRVSGLMVARPSLPVLGRLS